MDGFISDLNQWNEITRGLYRYIISAGACYEIHILYRAKGTDVLSANASLYIAADWCGNDGDFFERECLLEKAPVMACLGKAIEDYKENIKED